MANASDAQILADANKRLGKKYKTIKEYLTDNGRLKETGDSYKRRLAVVENARGAFKRSSFVESGQWNDYIKKNYGWLVNVYSSNPEVADIIRNGYIYDEPPTEIVKKINSSKWALGLQEGEADYLKGTSTNDRTYLDKIEERKTLIKTQTSKLGYELSDDKLNLLAAGSLKGNWDQSTLSIKIGESIVQQAKAPQGTVMPGTPTGAAPTSLQKGPNASSIKSLARSYGIQLSDSAVEGYSQSIISGSLSLEQMTSQFRNQAKSLYPSLASQLDSGTLDDATGSYRQIAARTLGIDSSSIDFTDATKFGKLLTYQDPKTGEARLMNATEWTQYLRELPDWDNTEESKNQYSGMIDTISKIFGKVGY